MTINFIEGDLLDLRHGFTDICHGVNLSGVMDGGIAKTIRDIYGEEMYEDYYHWCTKEDPILGDVMSGSTGEELPILWNLATQLTPGPHAERDAVLNAFRLMMEDLDLNIMLSSVELPIHVGVPQIGCGIGGLSWDTILPKLIEIAEEFEDINVTFVTYKETSRVNVSDE